MRIITNKEYTVQEAYLLEDWDLTEKAFCILFEASPFIVYI